MKYCKNLSYQIIVNAYLREVEHTWTKVLPHEYSNTQVSALLGEQEKSVSSFVRITLPEQAHEILVGVSYWSLTLRHKFIFPIMTRAQGKKLWRPLELSHFISLTMREEGFNNKRGNGELNTLILRCLTSSQNTNLFVDYRSDDIENLYDGRPLSFIESEQSLLIGHQLHPVSKSREGFSSTELLHYSPETAGKFQLHYFSADESLIHQDSALQASAADIVKQELGRQLENHAVADELLNVFSDENQVLIPVHPWQADYLKNQNKVKALLDGNKIRYWGPLGDKYSATTSVRTVFNENSPFMLKFSLNVKITNSERVNKYWELDRVVETARMMQLPVADEIKKTAPQFEIVNEPAFLTLKIDGEVLDGFSCIFRDASQFTNPNRDITAVTSLVQDHPNGAHGRLYNIISKLSTEEGRLLKDVAKDWFDRYVTVSIESLMNLFMEWGLCFEPHGQNTLLELEGGYPVRCFCRDGQGFFHRQASHEDWCKIIPGKGEATESIFPEDLARERLIYYPFINQVFSVINAFGIQGIINESELMNILRNRMRALNKTPSKYPFTLLDVLEENDRLPCKGNLLTQLFNMDELVGDIATQSVYVTVKNSYKNFTP